METQSLKILPKNFENALNSADEGISNAYQKWREKDFLGWWTEGEIERALQADKPNYSEKEWLQIFPEASSYLVERFADLKKEERSLRQEIKSNLLEIYKKVKDEFSIWFCEKVLEVWKGEKLNQLSKEVRKIKWTLNPEKDGDKTNKITDGMIRRAKDYPFDKLIKFNRAKKTLCEFHNDKNPSMSLNRKTNRVKCFACGVNFDPIAYVMETQKVSFIEAVKYLNN